MASVVKPAIATLLACAFALGTSTSQAERREAYALAAGSCDGWPRLAIGMAKGYCAGLVAGPVRGAASRTLRFPRQLAQLDDDTWFVTDLGGWGTSRGAVWKLETKRGEPTRVSRVLGGLDLPHATAMGADGKIYVGEMSRIFRFDPRAVVGRLLAGEGDFFRIDEHNEIAGVDAGRVSRTVAATDDGGSLDSETAERNARGIDEIPLGLHRLLLGEERFHAKRGQEVRFVASLSTEFSVPPANNPPPFRAADEGRKPDAAHTLSQPRKPRPL